LLKQSGGEFATLPDGTNSLTQRIKSTDSLSRKIDGDAKVEFKDDKKAAALAVSDAIRYTALVPEGSYADGLNQTIKTLEDAKFTIRTIKNFWQTGDPYDGVNIKASKNGIQVELQIHTPTSYKVKEGELHDIYEVYRESADNGVRRSSWDKMVEIAKSIPRPANYQAVLGVGTLITQQFQTAEQAGLV
jgi:hypothetical protein